MKLKKLTTINLPKLTGERKIEHNDKITCVDGDFDNWNARSKRVATKSTDVDVYELVENATLQEMADQFTNFTPFETEGQIIEFVEKHQDLLSKDWFTFFPYRAESGDIFVAGVYFDVIGRLGVGVSRLSFGSVWGASYWLRFVLPATSFLNTENSDTKVLNSLQS